MCDIVNPYIAGAPVTEQRMFFGREDIFQWVENSIGGQYADHILVVHGQRRVGKTSVLKQLGNRLPKRYIPVFFDLQGRTHTTLDHFLWWLARESVRVLKQDRDIEIPSPEKQAFASDPEYFENQFLSGLRSALGNNTLLLTFDEFDNLEESEVKGELARPLIDHLRRLMGQPNLNFVFSIGSSGRKLENMQASYTDFFKTALYKKISFLNEEQTQHLVTRPVEGIIEYERAAVERIYSITSGHPYFTQLTCHELFARCQRTEQRKISKADVEAVLDDVVERGTVNLKFVWDEASDIEKWSLAALAQLDKTDNRAVADYLRKNRVRFSETDLNSGLLHLREKDVLTPQNRFVIHLLRRWLQKNRPIEQAREELTEANPIASRFIEIGLEFREGGQPEKAIEFFRQALSVSSDNLQAQVNIALTYATQGQLEQAIAEFEKALTIDDEDVASRAGLCDAHLALGDAALKRGRAKEAVLSYQRVLAINAEHLEARGRMAELSRQRAEKALTDGKDEEALSAFTEALKFTPEDRALIARSEKVRAEKNAKVLAELDARSGKEENAHNWDKAIEALNAALKIAPGDESILKRIDGIKEKQLREQLDSILSKVEAAEKAGRWDTAIAGLQEYLQLKPEDPAIQKRIADLVESRHAAWLKAVMERVDRATATQNWDEALSTLNEALRLEPENTRMQEKTAQVHEMHRVAELNARLQRADQAMEVGGWDEAIDILNDGLASDPENETLKTKLAEARKAKREARLGAALRLAESAAQAGKWEAAVASLNEVLANEPDNAEFQKKLAEVLAREHQNRWESARAEAEGLRETERFGQALQVWQSYLSLYPEDRERVDGETKPITQERELFDLYGNAEGAIAERDFDKAIPLLKEIIIRDENYKDTSRLLTNAIESRRTGTSQKLGKTRRKPTSLKQVRAPKTGDKRILIIGGFLVILALAIAGVIFGPKLWEKISIGTQQAAGGTPTSSTEMVSFDPILAYIAKTQPDFEDDFSSDKWGDLAEGISTKNLLQQDETLILNLEAGTNSEKFVLGGSNFQASQFALEFDFYFDGGTGGTFLGVGFPSLSTETNNDITIYLEEQSWSIDNTVKQSGEINETLVGQWSHLQIIYSDSQVAAFLNGKLLGNAEGISHPGNEIWIAAVTEGQGKLRLDNIKFWNLDTFNSSVVAASPTPALDPTIQIALDAIQNRSPLYQTGFDIWVFGDPVEDARVENGKFILTSKKNEPASIILNDLSFDKFAVSFDLRILESANPQGSCVFETGNERLGESKRAISAEFQSNGNMSISKYVHSLNGNQSIADGTFDETKANAVTLIFLGDRIAALINGQLTYSGPDPDGSVVYAQQGFSAYNTIACELDNFKLWDLSMVDFSASTGTSTISPTSTSTPKFSIIPDTRILNLANQHLYLYIEEYKTWHDARDYCAGQGGYLITIQDDSENLFIYKLTRGITHLGATDEEVEGVWAWVSGEPWEYANWSLGEPNNTGSGEDYLGYSASPKSAGFEFMWSDRPDGLRYFVCEWEPATTALTPETQVSSKDGMPMMYVAAGDFTMGSNMGSSNEKPVHTVHLDPFWMDQTEVTNRMYSLCVSAGVCQAPKELYSYSRDSYYGNSDFDNYPVIYIDWDMANTYCKWVGRRLPTEAEWEKAARGTSMYTYPWGEGLDCDNVNAMGCKGETSQVGEYELGKSPYGVFDMAGNVMEWVADWYSSTYYENSPRLNPLGPSSGTYHVLRGGSWKSIENNLRSSYRFGLTPDMTNFYLIGFRCAMGATQ